MILHNPVETPKVADFSFAISPGRETRVIVKPRISTARKTIVSIPQRKRKCFFTSERKLRYYRTYTQRNCALECEANFTQNLCQCVQYYMPSNYINSKMYNRLYVYTCISMYKRYKNRYQSIEVCLCLSNYN